MTEAKRVLIWTAVSSKVQAKDDKISLALQERLGREFAASIGGVVVDVLRVPGHSRSDDDIIAMLEEHAQQGCFAYHELRKLWYSGGFDVLWTHTDDRLARSATGITWVMTNTIKNGMSIYMEQQQSWITREDAKFKTLMSAMSAGESVKQFVTKSQATKEDKASRGINTSGNLPFGLMRREGDCVTIPDEQYRNVFNDIAALILEKLDWDSIESELFERFHHVNPRTGKPFAIRTFYVWMHNPWVWGHGARGWRDKKYEMAVYAYDEAAPVPPEVRLWRHNTGENKAQPVYTGELAVQLKAELKRRLLVVRGKSRAAYTRKFAGLLLCGECGYSMIAYNNRKNGVPVYMVCNTGFIASRRHMPLCKHRHVRIDKVQLRVREYLDDMQRLGAAAVLSADSEDLSIRRKSLEAEHNTLAQQIDRLANRLATVSDAAVSAVQAQLNQRAERKKAVEAELQKLLAKQAAQDTRARDKSLEFIQSAGDSFWTLPEAEINEHLHNVFGEMRMVSGVRDIAGLMHKPIEYTHRKKPQL